MQLELAAEVRSPLRIRIPSAIERESSTRLSISSNQEEWFGPECVDVRDGRKYRVLNCKKANGNIPYNVVFPSQFAHLVIQDQQHPEAKSRAPNGSPCMADTKGLLQRAHVMAGEIRYMGKETDRKWEEGEEIGVLEFAATE